MQIGGFQRPGVVGGYKLILKKKNQGYFFDHKGGCSFSGI